jgi:hypothetical protein
MSVCLYILYANLQFYSDLDEILYTWSSKQEENYCLLKFYKNQPLLPFLTLLRKKDSFFELEIPSPSPLHPYFILWVYRHLRRLTQTKSNPYYHF